LAFLCAARFSTLTPLNFLAAFFFAGRLTAMNSPLPLLRFVQPDAPPMVVFVCERFFTAPLRALSPIGLLTAMLPLLLLWEWNSTNSSKFQRQ
jgi:hypothetical protein